MLADLRSRTVTGHAVRYRLRTYLQLFHSSADAFSKLEVRFSRDDGYFFTYFLARSLEKKNSDDRRQGSVQWMAAASMCVQLRAEAHWEQFLRICPTLVLQLSDSRRKRAAKSPKDLLARLFRALLAEIHSILGSLQPIVELFCWPRGSKSGPNTAVFVCPNHLRSV